LGRLVMGPIMLCRGILRRAVRAHATSVDHVESRPEAPILLVDDEPANLLAMEAVLQGLGEPIVRAASGEAAMRRLRDRDFAAVLLDLRMPGMDGIETARLIRAQKRSRETPILFMTADASEI